MQIFIIISLLFSSITILNAQSQAMKEVKNPLLCEPETGVCEPGGAVTSEVGVVQNAAFKPIRIIYFTDPICSSCWGIEPQLRKLKLEYGELIEFEYRMGGLLPDWSYNSGGISKPSDVAHHWDEVSAIYRMPIDGDVWLEDPLDSSYPPSIAFKAAQMQDGEKAIVFLRRIREMVFLEKLNITRPEILATAAKQCGLDSNQLLKDMEDPAELLFKEDLELARSLNVRGFPTLFFTDRDGNQLMVYGFKPYSNFESTLLKLIENPSKNEINPTPDYLFRIYNALTTNEFAVLTDISFEESEILLSEYSQTGKIIAFKSKNGILWKRNQEN